MNDTQLTLSCHSIPGPQPVQWYLSHLGWAFPSQGANYRKSLIDMPKGKISQAVLDSSAPRVLNTQQMSGLGPSQLTLKNSTFISIFLISKLKSGDGGTSL